MSSNPSKVSLWSTPQQRRQMEDLAELYAIIRTTEKLELAYARDAIASDAYTEACQRLLTQFKTTERALRTDGTIRDAAAFMDDYHLDCPRAAERLLTSGVPATIMDGGSGGGATKGDALLAAEATSVFITTMDTVKLNQRAVDALQPVVQDLVRVLNKCDALVPGFNRAPLQKWLAQLNALRAADELDDDQMRQLTLDLDNCFHSFMEVLRRDR